MIAAKEARANTAAIVLAWFLGEVLIFLGCLREVAGVAR